MPAIGPSAQAPDGDWGWVRVPGTWDQNWSAPGGPLSIGSGASWAAYPGQDGKQVSRVWYRRTFNVPEDWAGRAIELDFQRISTDSVVFVNGQECGRTAWPGGVVDITKAVRIGQSNELLVLVIAVQEEKEVVDLMGTEAGHNSVRVARLASRGIIGDVILSSMPQGSRLAGIFIRPSVRQKKLFVDLELEGVPADLPVNAEIAVFDLQGVEQKRVLLKAVTEASGGKETVLKGLSLDWIAPKLWDVGQPNLYRLRLKVTGKGLADEYSQLFGFRECWVEGRKVFLNGTEFRMRPWLAGTRYGGGVPELIEGLFRSSLDAGFNVLECWPEPDTERGRMASRQLEASLADRVGMPLLGNATSMAHLVNEWQKPGVREGWEAALRAELRRMRNHPSIIMWATSPNMFGHGDDQNPLRIGMKKGAEAPLWKFRAKIGEAAVATIKALDPTRPVLVHQGASVGDVYAANTYPNLIPLQEREEWLSAWAQHGEMPYMAVEFGVPLSTTMMRGRNGGHRAGISEPLMTEFTASYLGSRAYDLESKAYRTAVADRQSNPPQKPDWAGVIGENEAAFQEMLGIFIPATWRSWRAFGISGGMVPWGAAHGWEGKWKGGWGAKFPTVQAPQWEPGRRGGYLRELPADLLRPFKSPENVTLPAGVALLKNNGPVLAYLAGGAVPGDPAAFTAKDHHYYAGETLKKQIVLLNDSRERAQASGTWSLVTASNRLAGGSFAETLAVAETKFVPFEAVLPAVTEPTEALLRLECRVGGQLLQDEFKLRIYPKLQPAPGLKVVIVDPLADTARMLANLNIAVDEPGPATKPAPGTVLVVGRGAFKQNGELVAQAMAFANAGAAVIVFGQDPDWLREKGFRVSRYVSRRFWPVPTQTAHPVVTGLDAEDFRDWRGAGTLVPASTADAELKRPIAHAPKYGWHWGNRGSVSSSVVEKPHYGPWTPLLEGEFDLAYSPLLEATCGAGRVLYCGLDVEGRERDEPVAALVVHRLIAYAQTAPKADTRAVAYLGGPEGQELLTRMGVVHEASTTLPAPDTLVVAGPDAAVSDEACTRFLQQGGRIFFLARRQARLPLGFVVNRADTFTRARELADWPELRGLSYSDLRTRVDVFAPLVVDTGDAVPGVTKDISGEGILARASCGSGTAVYFQMTPPMLKVAKYPYLKYSEWRMTRALSQILANMGAAFAGENTPFGGKGASPFYVPGFIEEKELGDDPARYFRW